MDLFVLPYSSLGSMLYLTQAAKWYREKPGEAPAPAEETLPEDTDPAEDAAPEDEEGEDTDE